MGEKLESVSVSALSRPRRRNELQIICNAFILLPRTHDAAAHAAAFAALDKRSPDAIITKNARNFSPVSIKINLNPSAL